MTSGKLTLIISDDDADVAYLYLRDHPGPGVTAAVSRTTRLLEVLKYTGPDIHLDFDEKGRLIGIEVVGSSTDSHQ